MRSLPRLHLVTDDDTLAGGDFVAVARGVLEAGGADLALHLRGPHTDGRRYYALAEELARSAETTGSLLVANDRVDVALALSMAAVQLGARALPVRHARELVGPEVLIGSSVHGLSEARGAVEAGADFLLLGTVYATPSHPGREGEGPGLIRRATEELPDVPVVAIGGVTPTRSREITRAGGYGVAVLRGVWHAPDPPAAIAEYTEALSTESKRPLDGMNTAP